MDADTAPDEARLPVVAEPTEDKEAVIRRRS